MCCECVRIANVVSAVVRARLYGCVCVCIYNSVLIDKLRLFLNFIYAEFVDSADKINNFILKSYQ